LVGQVLSQSLFNIPAGTSFNASVDKYQTIYFKTQVPVPYDSSEFSFTLSPCNGFFDWYVGPKGEKLGEKNSNREIFYFDTEPKIYVEDPYYINAQDIVTVATFTLENYSPGYYYVGVTNKENYTVDFQGYFGNPLYDPHPAVGGSGNIDVFVDSPTSVFLSWDYSTDVNVLYCVYVQSYDSYYFDQYTVHGSACGIKKDNKVGCTALNYLSINGLHANGTYFFDVTVSTHDDENPIVYVSAYNGVVANIKELSSATSLTFFSVATIFAILIAFF